MIIVFCIMATSLAQDDAERRYLYPVFPDGPGHAMYPGQKPKVGGWANERVVERLNRGIIAQQTQAGEVYIGWCLLETDGANITFNLTTPIPAKDRRVTLLQDPVYRSTVTHNSMGYYQSPMTSVTQQADIMDRH